MDKQLNETEARVLGALVEKQMTTPEYYPLTLNALVQATNQKNNRNPVVSYDEATVSDALETLRAKNLVYVFYGSTSRVPKYKHMMGEVFHLDAQESALVCVLLLRGPQTPGELRGRTERLHNFSNPEEVEETLNALSTREEPLVARLPRQPGQKESRFMHLLSGAEAVARMAAADEAVVEHARSTGDRYSRLEQEVERLRAQVETLQREFAEFKKQFE